MAKMKTDKYIVTEMDPNFKTAPYGFDPVKTASMMKRVLRLDGEVIKDAFYLSCGWFIKPTGEEKVKTHVHDFDEVVAFFGADADNPYELGGEIELWIDGEKHLLTRSCMVFIPKGMKHCPMSVTKVTRPIFHFTTGPANKYH
jgi:hypothetical protein